MDMGRQRACLAVQTVKRLPSEKKEREREKEKAKAKVDSRELVTHTLVKNKHKTMIGGHKKTVFGGQKGKKGRKRLSKGKNKFPESDSRTFQDQDSDKEFQSNKGTSKDQSKRGKESSCSIRIFCLRIAK